MLEDLKKESMKVKGNNLFYKSNGNCNKTDIKDKTENIDQVEAFEESGSDF